MLLLGGCSSDVLGGGMSLPAAEATAARATSAAATALKAERARIAQAPPPVRVAPPLGVATTASLSGWHVAPGSGGPGPLIAPGGGDPSGPALQLPGNRSYVWQEPKAPTDAFSFDVKTEGLVDFFFGANAAGRGYMFRIDTRGGANYSGFAPTANWLTWDCPASGTDATPAGAWIHVAIAIHGTAVTATATWPGQRQRFALTGQTDGCATAGGPVTLRAYRPLGTAFGFQGDALGASSLSWIANFG